MVLSLSQRATMERVRSLGTGGHAVLLTPEICTYLIGVIANDLGVIQRFPEFKKKLTPFFTDTPLQNLRIGDIDYIAAYERLLNLDTNADTYFVCLAALHKGRLKYEHILRTQPMPTIEQVGPRALLQYGALSSIGLASLLVWRKWIYDLDNRAAQETGYIFESIIANAIGGAPVPAARSPVRRVSDNEKGRQVDCILGASAYEIKLRVTIAASGQGRWKEELDFPADCKKSKFTPVLVVLDGTVNKKLTQLAETYRTHGGEVYIGAAAWRHLEALAGATMAKFLKKYVRAPLNNLLGHNPKQLPPLSATLAGNTITLAVGDEHLIIERRPNPEAALDEDQMPADVNDQLPDT